MLRLAFVLCMISGALLAEGEPTPEALGKQFDAQVARLVERGYPALFGDRTIFDEKMAKLREEAVRYVPAKPNYTFLIVIPRNYAPLPWQTKQITTGTLEQPLACVIRTFRFVFQDRANFHDEHPTPDKPYLIYDVDLGADTVRQWVCDTIVGFPKTHRRGLTVLECTALLVQRPDILSGAKIAAIGTFITDPDPLQMDKLACWFLSAGNPHTPIVDAVIWRTFNEHAPHNFWVNFQFPTCKE